jgi:hypothetical protein
MNQYWSREREYKLLEVFSLMIRSPKWPTNYLIDLLKIQTFNGLVKFWLVWMVRLIETNPGAMIGSGLTVRSRRLILLTFLSQFSQDISDITNWGNRNDKNKIQFNKAMRYKKIIRMTGTLFCHFSRLT